MSDTLHLFIRQSVQDYVSACQALMLRLPGSHGEFVKASRVLGERETKLTDAERDIVMQLVLKLSSRQ